MVDLADEQISYTVQRHTRHPNLRAWTVLMEQPRDGWTLKTVCVPGFDTAAEARQAVDGLRFVRAHTDDRTATLTREEYERRCAAADIEAWSEARLWQAGYALRYFDHPGICDDPSGRTSVATWLHQRRAYGIEAAREQVARQQALAAAPARAAALAAAPRCTYRGCQEPATMSASLGPACPEHYDALSA